MSEDAAIADAQSVFQRLVELLQAGECETAVLRLPDSVLHEFSEYLCADPLESAIRQTQVEQRAALRTAECEYDRGVFGCAMSAQHDTGIAGFQPPTGLLFAMAFDLADEDLLVTLLTENVKVEHDVVFTAHASVITLPLEQLPPDTPGLLLIHELTKQRGFL